MNTQQSPIRIRAIDLFCGAGGSSYGARQAGVEIVAAFDIWRPAVDTFNRNFGAGVARQADIFDLDVEALHAELGKIDLILASPECTNHSKAKGKGIRCERSRETALEVVRFAETFKPRWVVIENVVEMQDWHRHDELKQRLEELDYNITEPELDAEAFGVAQSRKRLFMLCVHADTPPVLADVKSDAKTARDIVSKNTYKLNQLRIPRRAGATLAKADYAIAQMQSEGKPPEPFLIVYYGSAKNGGNGGWQSLDRPLRTITTLDRFGYVVPGPSREQDRMRMLQPEELKLAMGYGDDFVFAEGLPRRDKIKLMGNGVCPPVMKAIVESLTRSWQGDSKESLQIDR
ncbi:DNA cytosine methyltransferase [Candidatus Amarolinea aalborgensis]|uniref:DNA cytosine methyltransferase n=1 Tax=Candidatus Amarolinea aalborgensis TaxID=2249329 RepID=UPI003BF9D006